jgi:4-hydroxybenzoate polyprenyltransferase
LGKIGTLLEMIKFEHSIFALPFALAAAFLATAGKPGGKELLWVVAAMVGARSLAMTLNRIVDHRIDALNPRTASRALPAGQLSRREAWIFATASLALLLLAVYNLDPICRRLWPALVLLFFFYPYTKRFTWTSHFVLGLCLGLAPVGTWVALTGEIISPIWPLGLAVTIWTAGFDIIYACQDIDVDQRQRLFSIPSRFGPRISLLTARLLHVASIFLFFVTGYIFSLSTTYYIGVFVVSLLLLYEHRLVSPTDFSRLDMAFFTMNGVIAALFFFFTAADLTLARIA